jgi:hypothetical protein
MRKKVIDIRINPYVENLSYMTLKRKFFTTKSTKLDEDIEKAKQAIRNSIQSTLDQVMVENLTRIQQINNIAQRDPDRALIELENLFPGTKSWIENYVKSLTHKDTQQNYSPEEREEKRKDNLYLALINRISSLSAANKPVKTDEEIAAARAKEADEQRTRAREEWLKERQKEKERRRQDSVGGRTRRAISRKTSTKKQYRPHRQRAKTTSRSRRLRRRATSSRRKTRQSSRRRRRRN